MYPSRKKDQIQSLEKNVISIQPIFSQFDKKNKKNQWQKIGSTNSFVNERQRLLQLQKTAMIVTVTIKDRKECNRQQCKTEYNYFNERLRGV